MSDHRIAELEREIAEAKQRQIDFQAYPDAVEAAKTAEESAKAELAELKPKSRSKKDSE